ncbi:MAG TPA: tRNA (5-methylaminomethyl-2-thiouridine)(34)-methyltransferase MnmD [Bacteroidales bacterium]|nr:tRNA (5-methylaminomethyl-2-thiouridine)(34)-methyltransferase MnmD [Bacteroidales bacterium]HPI68209.1 tRNA (5-methylaminomethyl-2-thiouridine)(34)-methyltransferase MnmD [Bacteroidales bacterium]HPR72591.1 tRNA (5-methylaminomethyl-2-thiouridine)(34)-methyltransferase MnmD [Bacteroidales bacterium]
METLKHIVTTSDGSHSIYVPELDEHYHSVFGAVQESRHIFIMNGMNESKASPLRIFEVGFGTGLNALLTACESIDGNREIFYTSIDKYPLDKNIIGSLNHFSFAGDKGKDLFIRLHEAKNGVMTNICKDFSIRKITGDFLTYDEEGSYDLIYFDAFGPDKQPEMWTSEIFKKIFSFTVTGGILVTYSAKGTVKRNLRSSGFEVSILGGPQGKRHIIRAVKK